MYKMGNVCFFYIVVFSPLDRIFLCVATLMVVIKSSINTERVTNFQICIAMCVSVETGSQ